MKLAVVAALLLAASSASAAEPTPRERMAALRWMVASWQCEGKRGTEPFNFGLVFSESLQGAWLDGHMTIKRGEKVVFELMGTLGYDAGEKSWVRWDRTSTGGTKMLTSTGPTADAITFAGREVDGGFREEMKKTQAGMSGRIDIYSAGKWNTEASFDCKSSR